jgi:MOSC domain-containing protein YiiM
MWIRLIAGFGIEGDANAGETVKHQSRVARDKARPNLRQVHLLQTELLDELRGKGFDLGPGEIGENVLTEGVDLLGLSAGTRVRLGESAIVEVTGLRDPCIQMERHRKGLMAATLDRDANGALVRKAGVMGIVVAGGEVRPGDPIQVAAPDGPHRPLVPV